MTLLAATPAVALPDLPTARRLALAGGALMLLLLWLGPLPAMARTAFSPHMILHLGLIVLAAPLLAYGIAPLLRPLGDFRSALSWGLLAAVLDVVVVWGWHIPLLHALSARYDAIFVLQQLSFVAAGLAVWTVAFNARSRAAMGIAALVLFLTFTHMSMFGLVITLAPRLLYDPSFCLGAFGLSSIDDQRLGGILMAVCGGIPFLIGTAAIAWRFLESGPNASGDGAYPSVLIPRSVPASPDRALGRGT